MKSFNEFLEEKWVEYERKIAGNIDDPSFHPSQQETSKETTKNMVKKLNKIFFTGGKP
jgi:hypothetical protein